MIIYALHAGGSHALCYAATVERAKQEADERLKSYHESAKAHPEEWEDAAQTVDSLEWELKPYTFANGAFTEPKPRWTALVSDMPSDTFTIREVEVLE